MAPTVQTPVPGQRKGKIKWIPFDQAEISLADDFEKKRQRQYEDNVRHRDENSVKHHSLSSLHRSGAVRYGQSKPVFDNKENGLKKDFYVNKGSRGSVFGHKKEYVADAGEYGMTYGQSYDPRYGQPFGQSFGQSFGQPYGQSFGQPYGQPLSPLSAQPYSPVPQVPQVFQLVPQVTYTAVPCSPGYYQSPLPYIASAGAATPLASPLASPSLVPLPPLSAVSTHSSSYSQPHPHTSGRPSTSPRRGYTSWRLKRQIGYYFSVDNLCKDLYLRQHMDNEGYVSLIFIFSFSRVRNLVGQDFLYLVDTCRRLDSLEVTGEGTASRVRLRVGWERWAAAST